MINPVAAATKAAVQETTGMVTVLGRYLKDRTPENKAALRRYSNPFRSTCRKTGLFLDALLPGGWKLWLKGLCVVFVAQIVIVCLVIILAFGMATTLVPSAAMIKWPWSSSDSSSDKQDLEDVRKELMKEAKTDPQLSCLVRYTPPAVLPVSRYIETASQGSDTQESDNTASTTDVQVPRSETPTTPAVPDKQHVPKELQFSTPLLRADTQLLDNGGISTEAKKVVDEIPDHIPSPVVKAFILVAFAGGTDSWEHFIKVANKIVPGGATFITDGNASAVARSFFTQDSDLSLYEKPTTFLMLGLYEEQRLTGNATIGDGFADCLKD